jgi:hypothetical protein
MTADVLAEKMDNKVNELIEIALNPSEQSQNILEYALERASDSSGEIVSLWDSSENYSVIPSSLRLLSTLACLPSLKVAANGKPHGNHLAKRVYGNFQSLSQTLVDNEQLWSRGIRKYDRELHIETVGKLSEVAIMGAIWAGIANRWRSSDFYAWPTTIKEDEGEVLGSGERTGIDINLFNQASDVDTQFVQVKTAHRTSSTLLYRPGIAVVTIENLHDGLQYCHKGPFALIRWVADNERGHLSAVNRQIDQKLNEAQIDLARHEAEHRLPWQADLSRIAEALFPQTQAA